MRVRRPGTRFESVYSVVVLVKGLDGLAELLTGAVLLVAPGGVQALLLALAGELSEGASAFTHALAGAAEQAGDSVDGGVLPIAAFLLVHGAVKLLTVYCLLRRLTRWYPWAIAVLGVLLVVQVADAVSSGSAGTWALSVLDVLVLSLVVYEYRRLRRGGSAPAPSPAA